MRVQCQSGGKGRRVSQKTPNEQLRSKTESWKLDFSCKLLYKKDRSYFIRLKVTVVEARLWPVGAEQGQLQEK